MANFKYQQSCHTDLALEMKEEWEQFEKLTGVEVSTSKYCHKKICQTRIKIVDEEGERALGKPKGNYVTLEVKNLEEDVKQGLSRLIAKNLDILTEGAENILIAGLGNRSVTPDAIGPKVLNDLLVTRHLFECDLIHESEKGMRVVSAISPGVMAQTGIETMEILKGIVDRIKPQVIIVVDALAARSSNRLNRTVQLSDTGISPGAGVGNNRQEMNENTLGVKVVALGVPTVIAVPTLISDAISGFLTLLNDEQVGHMENVLTEQEQYKLAEELVKPYFCDMFVTPKNIDEEVQIISQCIAKGMNAFIKG